MRMPVRRNTHILNINLGMISKYRALKPFFLLIISILYLLGIGGCSVYQKKILSSLKDFCNEDFSDEALLIFIVDEELSEKAYINYKPNEIKLDFLRIMTDKEGNKTLLPKIYSGEMYWFPDCDEALDNGKVKPFQLQPHATKSIIYWCRLIPAGEYFLGFITFRIVLNNGYFFCEVPIHIADRIEAGNIYFVTLQSGKQPIDEYFVKSFSHRSGDKVQFSLTYNNELSDKSIAKFKEKMEFYKPILTEIQNIDVDDPLQLKEMKVKHKKTLSFLNEYEANIELGKIHSFRVLSYIWKEWYHELSISGKVFPIPIPFGDKELTRQVLNDFETIRHSKK